MDLIAIDPGKKTAIAHFARNQAVPWSLQLQSVILTDGENPCRPSLVHDPVRILVEWPEYRREGRGKKSTPEDLITLAYRAGRAVEVCSAVTDAPVIKVPVSAWKGQTTKEITWERSLRALSPTEIQRVPDSWDARDAVALGLWALRRISLIPCTLTL